MQVIIPLAGKGTRLRPHTHLTPKPLLKVAGRPVMDWVMDRLKGLDLSELIFITGHLKEQVEAYARKHYHVPQRFVEQRVQDGTAGAINLARPFVKEPVLIIFVDTVFDADLSVVKTSTDDGIIWAKEVEDYQRFGVVVTDAQGYMTRIVEKPKEPISKLANIGLYYIRDVDALWRGIEHVMSRPATLMSGLGTRCVCGRSRVPLPASGMMTCIRIPVRSGPGCGPRRRGGEWRPRARRSR